MATGLAADRRPPEPPDAPARHRPARPARLARRRSCAPRGLWARSPPTAICLGCSGAARSSSSSPRFEMRQRLSDVAADGAAFTAAHGVLTQATDTLGFGAGPRERRSNVVDEDSESLDLCRCEVAQETRQSGSSRVERGHAQLVTESSDPQRSGAAIRTRSSADQPGQLQTVDDANRAGVRCSKNLSQRPNRPVRAGVHRQQGGRCDLVEAGLLDHRPSPRHRTRPRRDHRKHSAIARPSQKHAQSCDVVTCCQASICAAIFRSPSSKPNLSDHGGIVGARAQSARLPCRGLCSRMGPSTTIHKPCYET